MSKEITSLLVRHKRQAYLLVIVSVFCVFFGLFLWDIFKATHLYDSLVGLFRQLTAYISLGLSDLLGERATYDSQTGTISSVTKHIKLVLPTGSYLFYTILLFFYLLVPPQKIVYVIALIAFTVIFVSLRASAITVINLFYSHQLHNILLLWIDPLIYIPMLISVGFIVRHNKLLNILYFKVDALFKPIINVSLFTIMLLMILLPPLPRVLLTYIDTNLLDSIVTFTLKGSQLMLSLFDYSTVVSTKFITYNNSIIQLEYPCLGLGVVTIITIFVLLIRANWLNKLTFLLFFIFLFSLMNSLRLAVTLLYIDRVAGTAGFDKVQTHDYITYFMYIVAFLSFLAYYFWYQDLVLIKRKTNK